MSHLTPAEIAWLEDELRGLDWGEVRIIVENGIWKKVERTSSTRAVDRSLQRPLLRVVPDETA